MQKNQQEYTMLQSPILAWVFSQGLIDLHQK